MNSAEGALAVVIEDDADIRDLEAHILRGDGWRVEVASRGDDGIALIRSMLPDVVICDLMLPDTDGLEIIRELQEDPATADIPVIVVSAMNGVRHVAAGIDIGAMDYITKPFEPAQLQLRARAALRVRRNYLTLLAAQDELRVLFEEAPIGKALVSTDGRFLRVNDALCKIVGYTESELLLTDFPSITHPDDIDADLDFVQQVLDGIVPRYSMEKRYLRADGSVVQVQLDVTLVRDRQGRPRHFIAQIQDISEREATTQSLLATQATQRASLDALEQGVALVGRDGRVRLLNNAGERILGFTMQELTERFQSGTWDTYDEDGRLMPFDERPLAHTLLTGEGVSDQILGWYSASGEFVTLRAATEALYNAEGEFDGLVVAFADITAQRAAERAEAAAVERLAWEASHDSLTGLANRSMLLDHLRVRLADPDAGHTALLYVDIDHFKRVNDTHGHDVGDELLMVVTRRLEQAVRPEDLVARYGGDEFLVVVAAEAEDDADRIAARILERLAYPTSLSIGDLATSVSIGLADAIGPSVDTLIRDADTALFRAKELGRGRVVTSDVAPA